MEVKQYDIYWVNLNPTVGSEINKVRPCVVISPNELNNHINTVIVAPCTSTLKPYPWRVFIEIEGKAGSIALDQIRTIDKARLVKHINQLTTAKEREVKHIIQQMLVD